MKNFGQSKISIIVPVYNAKKTLYRCINSLINQTYKNIEIICINDGSEDNSLDILQEFSSKDKRIKVFNQKNSGSAKARNMGLNNATGEYLMFCDADDWYENNTVELMTKTIIDKNTDLVMCNCNVVDLANGEIQTAEYCSYNKLNLSGYKIIDRKNIDKINVVLWNKIFKASIIKEHLIQYPVKYEHDDTIFLSKYLLFAKSYYGLDVNLYNYVVGNPLSIMGQVFTLNNNGRQYDFIYAWQDFWDYFNKFSNDKELKKCFIRKNYNIFCHYYLMLKFEDREMGFKNILKFIMSNRFLIQDKHFKTISTMTSHIIFEKYIRKEKVSFIEQIFSIKNDRSKKHKILRLAGLKLKFKRKGKIYD